MWLIDFPSFYLIVVCWRVKLRPRAKGVLE